MVLIIMLHAIDKPSKHLSRRQYTKQTNRAEHAGMNANNKRPRWHFVTISNTHTQTLNNNGVRIQVELMHWNRHWRQDNSVRDVAEFVWLERSEWQRKWLKWLALRIHSEVPGVKSVRRYSLCILFLWLSMWVKRKRRCQSNKWLQVLLMPLQAFGVEELLSWKNSDFFYFLWWNVFSKLFTDRKTHKGTGKVWRNILRRGKFV